MRGVDATAAAPNVTPGLSRFIRSFFRRLALIALASACAAAAGAAELHGHVVAVPDGDTVTVLDEEGIVRSVRLAGIDAPERKQRYGGAARDGLASLVFGRRVVVAWHKRDRYGRLVGVVRLMPSGGCAGADCSAGTDVGFVQLVSGFAWHYRQYEKEQPPEERRRYALAEQAARARRDGLWKDARPVPPWEYRSSRRTGVTTG